jgi:cardiolipin synthase
MAWLLEACDDLLAWLPALLALFHFFLVAGTITWILMTKADATSAVAWCLLIIFLPFLGAFFFYVFGYQHVDRPLKKKRRHKQQYQEPPHPAGYAETHHTELTAARGERRLVELSLSESLAQLAVRFGAPPVTDGNHIDFYSDGPPAFAAMLEAIEKARHHIHMEFFIWQPDEFGRQVFELLTAKAKAGVEVRVLYDAMGSHRLSNRLQQPLHAAGGRSNPFLPLSIWRRRLQVNLRNHRKIMVVDGAIGFTGGLNVGNEYLGKVERFGYWRDTHLRLRGPAVYDLQRVFCEDWDFATDERLSDHGEEDRRYFRADPAGGPYPVQIVDTGPDDDLKAIREVIFAGILKARRRVWIASPYFVPDSGLMDALRLAAYSGVDVRLLGQLRPDKWIPQYAARYWWSEMLKAGAHVYQYSKGMMHAKVMIVDDEFASVGTANLDNRSMFLNFEVNCLIYSKDAVRHLEETFERDFRNSILLNREVYATRPFAGRLLENACRLASPVL